MGAPLGGFSRANKIAKMAKVKNKAPADLQITAEQLLREAKERELEISLYKVQTKRRICLSLSFVVYRH